MLGRQFRFDTTWVIDKDCYTMLQFGRAVVDNKLGSIT